MEEQPSDDEHGPSMESQAESPRAFDGLAGVLAKLEGLALSQVRLEVLLVEVRDQLNGVAVQHSDKAVELPVPVRHESSQEEPATHDRSSALVSLHSSHIGSLDSGRMFASNLELGADDLSPGVIDALDGGEVPPSLPSHWPASVPLRLGHGASRVARTRGGIPPRKATTSAQSVAVKEASEDTAKRATGCMRHFMVDPNSSFYSVYSLMTILVLSHDVFVIPYVLAWDVPMHGFVLAAAWVSTSFWTVDIGLNFLVGYHLHGRLEMRPLFVMRRYVKSWLLLDTTAAAGDWVGLVLPVFAGVESTGATRSLRFAKLGKLVRLLALVRTVKGFRLIESYIEMVLAESAVLLRCVFLVGSMLFINHLLGCAWYAIGRLAPADTGMRWLEAQREWNDGQVNVLDFHELHQYLISFHWSIAQFTLGSMDIGAYNSTERIFSILCLAMGLIFGSTLVSTLSASMVDHQMTRNDQTQKLLKLRRYLRESNISRGVAALAQQQAKERLSQQARLQEDDVSALRHLSTSLRTTIRYELFKERLCGHALFRLWIEMDLGMARELSMEAMEDCSLRPHDELFVPGTQANQAYCVTAGRLTYAQDPASGPVLRAHTTQVEVGRWICEAALWAQWTHVGTARALTPCQVLSISGDALMALLAKNTLVGEISAEYGRLFHRRLVAARPPAAPWPNDLQVPYTDYSDIVVSMEQELQVAIGLNALEHEAARRYPAHRRLDALRQEVCRGQSCVMISAAGQTERLVSVVVLRLENSGKVFAELGRTEGSETHTCCRLPAAKQKAGEMPSATLARVLMKFSLAPEDVETVNVEREDEWKNSKDYGVRTKYLRTVYHARLQRDFTQTPLTLHQVTHTMSSLTSAGSDLAESTIYKIKVDDKMGIYSWLEPETFKYYSSPAGEKRLASWMAHLHMHSSRGFRVCL